MGRRGRRGAGPHGLVVIDKPVGPTSFRVMRRVQARQGAGRGGHAGTLDPAASGVLVVVLGEATKLVPWLMGHDKVYEAEISFGVETDTLDGAGKPVRQVPVQPSDLSVDSIKSALARLQGCETQVPPRYSALKVDGRTLMSRARAGEDFEVQSRKALCHELRLLGITGVQAQVHVHCGTGYYVRSMARDLGEIVGIPAHLSGLRRLRVGPYGLEDARDPDEVALEDIIPIPEALPGVAVVTLDAAESARARNGHAVKAAGVGERCILVDPQNLPIAMAERSDEGLWRVVRGFVGREPAQ